MLAMSLSSGVIHSSDPLVTSSICQVVGGAAEAAATLRCHMA